MCIAVPVKVIEIISDTEAVGAVKGVSKTVNTALIGEVEVGNYVLLHSGCAIQKLNQAAAQETLDAFRDLAQTMGEKR